MKKAKVIVIGAGSAGIYAIGQISKVTDDFVLIDRGPFGSTCARVGCMPSKVLIQIAEDFHRREALAVEGIGGAKHFSVSIPAALKRVRDLRDGFSGRLVARTEGFGDKLVRDFARFVEPNVVEAGGERYTADRIVVAVGSRPVIPAAWNAFAGQLLTTDSLFEQETLPPTMCVLGLGVIGLELGQALSRLGIDMTGVDMLETISGLTDPVVAESAIDLIGADFPLWLGAPAEVEQIGDGRLRVRAGDRETVVDKALVSLGRRSNIDRLNIEALGVPLDERGFPPINPETMQVGDLPIYFAGDVTGTRQILHEAADEGRIAGHNAVHDVPTRFRRKTPLAVTFTDPNIACVGADWRSLADRDDVVVGTRDFETQSRAKVMGKNRGILRVYGDKRDGRLLGAAMTAPKGEDLAHLLAWSIEQDLTVFDLLRMPFYHPVIEEGLQNALYDLAAQVEQQPASPVELVPA